MTTAKQIAHRAAQALDAKKGQDIKLLRVTDVTTLADYFLINRDGSMRHSLYHQSHFFLAAASLRATKFRIASTEPSMPQTLLSMQSW